MNDHTEGLSRPGKEASSEQTEFARARELVAITAPSIGAFTAKQVLLEQLAESYPDISQKAFNSALSISTGDGVFKEDPAGRIRAAAPDELDAFDT